MDDFWSMVNNHSAYVVRTFTSAANVQETRGRQMSQNKTTMTLMMMKPGIPHVWLVRCNPCTGRPSTCYHSCYHDDDGHDHDDDGHDDVGQDDDEVGHDHDVDDLSHVKRNIAV